MSEPRSRFDWSAYRGGVPWLASHTIFVTLHGSHAYGTQTPTSDMDFRGIAIAPLRYYFGFAQNFEQAVQAEPDLTIFELRKFFRLAADGNPNVIELLFTDESDHLFVDPVMRPLLAARDMFLSRRLKYTFAGYAIGQMKRINTHHRWLRNPQKAAPTRAEFELPERTLIPANQLAAAQSAIQKRLDQWNMDGLDQVAPAVRIQLQETMAEMLAEAQIAADALWKGAGRVIGFDENFIALLDRERRYTARQREWEQYNHWFATRNPARAELEAKHGLDTKHQMHLVRLIRMCREILTTGKVIVRRPDAEELLAIRNGAMSYEALLEWSEQQHKELNELVKVSALPEHPDREKLDELCMDMFDSYRWHHFRGANLP